MHSWVSVIIPVYNREIYILECLNSVQQQTYRPIEVIVVDDGSTDNSISMVKSFIAQYHVVDDFEIKWLSQANSGAPRARNYGFENAKGEYIQWLDSDDILLPHKLSHQIAVFTPNIDVVYSKTQMFLETKNQLLDKYWGRPLTGDDKDYFEFPWQTMCALYKKQYIEGNNLKWNENLKMHQDWEFSMQHVITSKNIVFLDEVNSLYRSHNSDRIGLNLSVVKLKSIEDALFTIYLKLESKRLLSKSLKFLYFKRLGFCFYKYGSDGHSQEKRAVWKRMFYIRKDLSLIVSPLLYLGASFFRIFKIIYKN